MKRAGERLAALALVTVGALFGQPVPAEAQSGGQPQRVIVHSTAIDFDPAQPSRRVFGALTYLGGIHVQSRSKRFGGLSGLAVSERGDSFVAISDVGDWVYGGIQYKEGVLADLGPVMMVPMRGAPGEAMRRKFDRDAEGLVAMSPAGDRGRYLVTFERRHRIAVYEFGPNGRQSTPRYLKLPAEATEFDDNKGLEAAGVFPPGSPLAGTIIVMAEQFLNADGNHSGWLIKGEQADRFHLARSDFFDVTGLVVLPAGDVIVLERRYSPFFGPAMRLRRIAADAIRPGALLDGEILIDARLPLAVDNMEGISWHRADDGSIVLSIVSDDNFRSAQKTLLLQFALRE